MKPLRTLLLVLSALACPTLPSRAAQPPNIVYILADDLGYGDVQCLNPKGGKILTPQIDRLATQGMTFKDAHGGSSVCTPTRYGILTGRYAWRTWLQSGVLGGFSPPLIEANRLTVPALLKTHGYSTSCIGKWHLGIHWPNAGATKLEDEIRGDTRDAAAMKTVDWSRPFQNGPTAFGFDEFFGISASLDMPPFVFLRNDRVTAIPTTEKKWVRTGPAAADFEAVDVLPALAKEAVAQIHSKAADAKSGKPFFLYIPLTSPHTPVLPSKEWQGKSGLGDYADFVMETDSVVGEILGALESADVAGNTLVIFTSDNGFSPAGDPEGTLRALGHRPAAEFRGLKSDIWDGGHRVPFFVRWPGKIKPATQSSQLICLTDLMATCAEILGTQLPQNAGEDSVSILPALLGNDSAPLHEAVVHHSINGRFAIRQGPWKLELCPGSGGWGKPGDAEAPAAELPAIQLYNLEDDVSESHNLQAEQPEVAARLEKLLERFVSEGRSTPGPSQANNVPVKIRKPLRKAAKE